MRDADNHVAINIDLLKEIHTTVRHLEEAGLEPDRVTIQQTDMGDIGEINLAYATTSDNE